MLTKNMSYTLMIVSLLFLGCSSKKVTVDTFKLNIIEVNKKVNFVNKKLMPKRVLANALFSNTFLSAPKECKLQRDNLLKLQKENYSTIDKVLKLNNLLVDANFSSKNKKEIEESLDNAQRVLFTLRQESKNRLLKLEENLKSLKATKNQEYLCSLELKPIPKPEACTNCRAVFN